MPVEHFQTGALRMLMRSRLGVPVSALGLRIGRGMMLNGDTTHRKPQLRLSLCGMETVNQRGGCVTRHREGAGPTGTESLNT